LVLKKEVIIPCTALAVMEILRYVQVPLYGKEIVIVGSSFIVGRPVALLLMKERASVHVLGSASSKLGTLEKHIRQADIVIAAAGEAHLIKGDWIREGAVVIDVGINELAGKTVGDVEFESAAKRAKFITPVPGGVGPLTATILMENLIKAFHWQKGPGPV
jgi:methylenetetrahydrofolate dehydrogenase (NADP+)/methenyltetrahydrofolate cyclohydrolase